MKDFSKSIGKIPTCEEIRIDKTYPAPITYIRHFGSWNNALKKAKLLFEKKDYSKVDVITPEILSKAIAYKFNESDSSKMENTSEIIMELFGYESRILDFPLDKKARNIFYILEKENIVSGEKEEDILYDGRKWTTHYWKLKNNNILKSANEYNHSLREKLHREVEITTEGDIYKKEEIWERNN